MMKILITIVGFLYLGYLIWKIIYAFSLLEGLSEDVSEIREKLGLEVRHRTRSQREEWQTNELFREILKGKTAKKLRESLGFWRFLKWRGYIEYYLEEYPYRTICPKCHTLSGKHAERCPSCKHPKMVPLKEYQETHPDETGHVDYFED